MIREVIVDLVTLVVKVGHWWGRVRYRLHQEYVTEETLKRYLRG